MVGAVKARPTIVTMIPASSSAAFMLSYTDMGTVPGLDDHSSRSLCFFKLLSNVWLLVIFGKL